VLLKHAEFFKMYVPYTNRYAEGQRALREARDHHAAETEEVLARAAAAGAPDVESLRIAPVQRIPRYVLLLTELDKKTKSSHPDSAPVRGALRAISVVAQHINERMRASELEAKILEIQASLWSVTSAAPELVAPGRRFVREGDAAKLRRDGRLHRNYHLFLFNDLVVYATRSPILRGRFHFHRAMEFLGAFPADKEVEDAGVALKYGEAAFKITGSTGYRIFVVDSDAERREWLRALSALLAERAELAERRSSRQPSAAAPPFQAVADWGDEEEDV